MRWSRREMLGLAMVNAGAMAFTSGRGLSEANVQFREILSTLKG